MFAVISWNSKNGVALVREELEVQPTSKYVVMNGGKQESGTAVSMQFRKDIWGGIIQSIHDSKKDAEKEVNKEISGVHGNAGGEVGQSEEVQGKRQKKRKSYGKEFQLDQSEEEQDVADGNGINESCSPVLKKSKSSDQTKEKRKKASSAKKNDVIRVTAQHDEMVITQILSSNSTSLPLLTNSPEKVAEKNHEDEPEVIRISTPEPAVLKPQGEKKLQHPHFGAKHPKQHKPPKCISVICKEEKENLVEELESTREKLNKALEELMGRNWKWSVVLPYKSKGSGKKLQLKDSTGLCLAGHLLPKGKAAGKTSS